MIDKGLGADDDLRRQVRARLSEGRLPAVDGVSKSHRGPAGLHRVPPRDSPTEVERQLDGVVVVLIAHEACYVLWREESVSHRRQGAEHDVESTSGKRGRPLHLVAGRIAEIGDGYVLSGSRPRPSG